LSGFVCVCRWDDSLSQVLRGFSVCMTSKQFEESVFGEWGAFGLAEMLHVPIVEMFIDLFLVEYAFPVCDFFRAGIFNSYVF
jgi:hypothetical protein